MSAALALRGAAQEGHLRQHARAPSLPGAPMTKVRMLTLIALGISVAS